MRNEETPTKIAIKRHARTHAKTCQCLIVNISLSRSIYTRYPRCVAEFINGFRNADCVLQRTCTFDQHFSSDPLVKDYDSAGHPCHRSQEIKSEKERERKEREGKRERAKDRERETERERKSEARTEKRERKRESHCSKITRAAPQTFAKAIRAGS